MGEQVELLEHHPGLAADLLDVAQVSCQLDAVDDDASLVVLLQPVDAADQCRLARTRRPDDDDDLLSSDVEVDVASAVNVPKRFTTPSQLDHDLACAGDLRRVGEHRCGSVRLGHLVPTPSLRSSRWLSRLIVMQPIQNMNMMNASVSAVSPWPRNSCCGGHDVGHVEHLEEPMPHPPTSCP